MAPQRNLLLSLVLLGLCCQHVHFHSLPKVKMHKQDADLRVEPQEAIVLAGTNVSFTCLHSRNTSFIWELNFNTRKFEVVHGLRPDNSTFYSRITIFGVSRFMSGEIVCLVDGRASKALGFLVVNVHSLYDPCEFNEQCSHLVDPKSICNSVCVCAPHTKDRKGTCILLNEISSNRSQEMYRVGLIAVTCIIILIVAMSLWITLKRTCHEYSSRRTQSDVIYPQSVTIEPTTDKPPSYDDIIESGDTVTAPPTMKDALKHCMTAKKLLRQVSAPAGQLLPQPVIDAKPTCDAKNAAKS